MKTYKIQRTKSCLWRKMCYDLETNTRKIKSNIDKYTTGERLNQQLHLQDAQALACVRRKILNKHNI